MTIPWRDDAVVIRTGERGGDREQVHHGILWQVVEWVRDQPDRERLTVWLPERRAQPFCFDHRAIGELLLRADRPRGSIGFS